MSVTALPTPQRRPAAPSVESPADAMRRLRAEAEATAREHSLMLEQAVGELESLAQDIAEGGEFYLGGVREVARRLIPELSNARMQLEAILGRKRL
jgi:hypothetical protein